MLACWQTYGYFNIYSNIVNKKNPKITKILATFFSIEIGTISPIIPLKCAEFLALMGIVVSGIVWYLSER